MSSRTFFTSDTHFGHKGILNYTDRPWRDTLEMDEKLIEYWNSVVRAGDHVYHLGDITFHTPKYFFESIYPRLNGQIHVVEGNHDKALRKYKDKFVTWDRLVSVKVNNQRIVLCHFPILSWENKHHGWWHLHGHSHGNLGFDTGAARLDVGVDNVGYFPVDFEYIQTVMAIVVDRPVDHHRTGDNK